MSTLNLLMRGECVTLYFQLENESGNNVRLINSHTSNNNNNNLRLLRLTSNRAFNTVRHPPRRAALYTAMQRRCVPRAHQDSRHGCRRFRRRMFLRSPHPLHRLHTSTPAINEPSYSFHLGLYYYISGINASITLGDETVPEHSPIRSVEVRSQTFLMQ